VTTREVGRLRDGWDGPVGRDRCDGCAQFWVKTAFRPPEERTSTSVPVYFLLERRRRSPAQRGRTARGAHDMRHQKPSIFQLGKVHESGASVIV
jgi:hypothetical protein